MSAGPWKVDTVVSEKPFVMVRLEATTQEAVVEWDRLIAAAPELLKALNALLYEYMEALIGAEDMGIVEQAQAAIAKATGEQP